MILYLLPVGSIRIALLVDLSLERVQVRYREIPTALHVCTGTLCEHFRGLSVKMHQKRRQAALAGHSYFILLLYTMNSEGYG